MSVATPQAKKRLDYRAPEFLIESVNMEFHLDDNQTHVKSKTRIVRQGTHGAPLVLSGEQLTLKLVEVNGSPFENYQETEHGLVLEGVPDNFDLLIETVIDPANNTSLEGLYLSSGAYCTQCEAEGFRKITYFLDRPDVLSEYRVKIVADKQQFPYLLSNGNKVESGDLADGKHYVCWHDPYKKPCYLFALVAGDFDLLEDEFVTKSGRNVSLQLFVDKGKVGRGQHALDSLKKAMKWDEDVFNLEYDLDIYMIVAVDFFNMGAMENKGLNVFNSKFVLADADSATDEDYFNIESVIAHEYFHNWTGNRVTCRDWFQLSLKEGLTVFRDQQFSADMSSKLVNRIKNVRVIREHQFAEDASAMSHPIRPDEVVEMNNFYTVTVYDKGAEVIRMMHTILGQAGFRKGMDLYFKRHDGQAVTCDDFVEAMQDANDVSLEQFKIWYGQSGTPMVKVKDSYDAEKGEFTLNFTQVNSKTADQDNKQNLHIPIDIELLSPQGRSLTFGDQHQTSQVYDLKEEKQQLSIHDVKAKPVPVLLRNFSAPVKVDYPYSSSDLYHIALHATDDFARWDACQSLYSQVIHDIAADTVGESATKEGIDKVKSLVKAVLTQSAELPAISAEMLTLPSFETLCQQKSSYDVEKLFFARETLLNEISNGSLDDFHGLFARLQVGQYKYEQQQVSTRRLRNLALSYMALSGQANDLITRQFSQGDNMTDSLGALRAAQKSDLDLFDDLMQQFEARWQDDPLVLDKWFGLHASTHRPDVLSRLDLLQGHKQFTINNPNRVRSLIGTFAFFNPMGFHDLSGAGYQYVADYLLKLDEINPQVASRIVTPLTQWQALDEQRQSLMRHQLMRLGDKKDLSKDLLEKVTKSLNYNPE